MTPVALDAKGIEVSQQSGVLIQFAVDQSSRFKRKQDMASGFILAPEVVEAYRGVIKLTGLRPQQNRAIHLIPDLRGNQTGASHLSVRLRAHLDGVQI